MNNQYFTLIHAEMMMRNREILIKEREEWMKGHNRLIQGLELIYSQHPDFSDEGEFEEIFRFLEAKGLLDPSRYQHDYDAEDFGGHHRQAHEEATD